MKKVILSIICVLGMLMSAPLAFCDVFITNDGTGTYVGGLSNLMPGGTYVGGTPTLTSDGFYVDGVQKKKTAFRNLKRKRKFSN